MRRSIEISFPFRWFWFLVMGGCASLCVCARAEESFRLGPFGVRSSVSTSVHFTDNVDNSHDRERSDYWFRFSTNHVASTRMAERHSLRLSTGAGFSKHPERPDLDSVSPLNFSTALSLNYDPLKINLSDNFAYESDALNQFFAAGAARVETLRNAVSLRTTYDPRPFHAGLAYYHSNVWYGSTAGQRVFNVEPRRRDMVIPSVAYWHVFPRGYIGRLGLEYRLLDANDRKESSVRLDAGFSGALTPQIDFNLGGNFALTGRTYYRSTIAFHTETVHRMKFRIETGLVVNQSHISSKLRYSPEILATVTHQLAERTTHRLDAQVQVLDALSIQQAESVSSLTDRFIVAYRIDHELTQRVSLGLTLSRSELRTVRGVVSETSTSWNAGLSTGYRLTEKLSLGARYTFIRRESDFSADREFDRNQIALTASYVF